MKSRSRPNFEQAPPRRERATAAHVVVAMKDLRFAKTRLASALAPTERAALALAMFEDVLIAASAVELVDTITVVTSDPTVTASAKNLGAAVIDDPSGTPDRATDGIEPLNIAYASGIATVRAAGGSNIVVLQADVPCLQPSELATAYVASITPGNSVVPDHRGTGTAALISKGGTHVVPAFGSSSARKHVDLGARVLKGHWAGLRLDVDTAQDLRDAYALGLGSATSTVVHRFPSLYEAIRMESPNPGEYRLRV